MNKYLFSLIFFLSLTVCIYSQTTPPEDDFQFWSDTSVSTPIYKTKSSKGENVEKIGFFFNGSLRVGRNISRPVDERIGVGFDFFINEYLTFTPSYFYRAAQPYKGREEYEHRLRFDLTVGKRWSNFSLRNRNRIEYRIRNSRSDSVRYRNRIQLTVPIRKDKKEVFAPFVSTEPFYDFREKKWTRNEFSVGIGKKFTNNFSTDFFYLLQSNRGNALKTINAFGVNFKIKID